LECNTIFGARPNDEQEFCPVPISCTAFKQKPL